MTDSDNPRQTDHGDPAVTDAELQHLRRCVELAAEAVDAGDEPFGSVLVAADGTALAEARNRERTINDATRHPEFELARWAATNMAADERAAATVSTSSQHCPMCAAAHGWGQARSHLLREFIAAGDRLARLAGSSAGPVLPLPIRQIVPHLTVQGPIPHLAEPVRDLHARFRDSSLSAAPTTG